MRPCTCERVKKGQPWDGSDCWPCWAYWHLPEFHAKGGGEPATLVISWVPTPAVLTQFNPPAPLPLTPKSPRAVATVAVGERGKELLAISGPRMKNYANRLGADFVVLDANPYPFEPVTAKWGVWRLFDHYERVVYLDADVLVSPQSVDLFELVPVDRFGAYDELAEVLMHWSAAIEGLQRQRESQGRDRKPVYTYFNSGVYVCSKAQRQALATPELPCVPHHCFEQDQQNLLLADGGIPTFSLPPTANYQWWMHKGFANAPDDAILHFSGIADHGERVKQMKALSDRLEQQTP